MIYTRENKPIDVKTNDPGSDTNFGFFLGYGDTLLHVGNGNLIW